jgi:hypothetical protein
MTASEHEQACSRFDRARLGYITVFDDGFERVCFLHDAEGVDIRLTLRDEPTVQLCSAVRDRAADEALITSRALVSAKRL